MKQKTRILGSRLARELTVEEQAKVAGGSNWSNGLCSLPCADEHHL